VVFLAKHLDSRILPTCPCCDNNQTAKIKNHSQESGERKKQEPKPTTQSGGGKRYIQKPKPSTQSGRGQAEQTRAKTNHSVRKGASGTTRAKTNQNQARPRRFQAPIYFTAAPACCLPRKGLGTCGGALGSGWFWLLFVPLAPFPTVVCRFQYMFGRLAPSRLRCSTRVVHHVHFGATPAKL